MKWFRRKKAIAVISDDGEMIVALCVNCLKNKVTFKVFTKDDITRNNFRCHECKLIDDESMHYLPIKPKEEPKMQTFEQDDRGYFIWQRISTDSEGVSYYHLTCVKCGNYGITSEFPPVNFNLCSKCFQNKGKNEMKEFDLRPFEVKKEIKYQYELKHLHGGLDLLDNSLTGLMNLDELCRQIEPCMDAEFKQSHPNHEYLLIKRTEILSRWTFKDIEIGHFFKVKGDSELTNVWLKVSDTDAAKVAAAHIKERKTSVLREPAQSFYRLPYYEITNVYKCDELYKHFMIEELKS